jgi:hypothetical protein
MRALAQCLIRKLAAVVYVVAEDRRNSDRATSATAYLHWSVTGKPELAAVDDDDVVCAARSISWASVHKRSRVAGMVLTASGALAVPANREPQALLESVRP